MTLISKPAIPAFFRMHSVPLAFTAIMFAVMYRRRNKFMRQLVRSESSRSLAEIASVEKAKKEKRVRGGTGSFVRDLRFVLKFGIGKRETLNTLVLTLALLLRTYMTLWIANSMGVSMKNFCNKNWLKVRTHTHTAVAPPPILTLTLQVLSLHSILVNLSSSFYFLLIFTCLFFSLFLFSSVFKRLID
jgi:hypothetical protein